MWYALHPTEDVIVLNATRGLLKERNLRRDARMSLAALVRGESGRELRRDMSMSRDGRRSGSAR